MIENTLFIRPKSGTFLRDVEFFGKMDPFLKISIGSEIQQTEAALNQGKTPVWSKTLSFKLSNQQLSQPETVEMKIEAYDDESGKTGKFLGSTTYKLSQVRTGPGEVVTIQLLDKKQNLSGTINVEFEVQQTRNPYDQGYNTQQSLQQMHNPYQSTGSLGHGYQDAMGQGGYGSQGTMGQGGYGPQGTMGTSNFPGGGMSFAGQQGDSSILVIRPKSGKFLKDADFFSGMDPWIKVTIDNEVQRTETANNMGKYPKWKKELTFKLSNQQIYNPDSVKLNFEAFDEDSKTKSEFLGSAILKLSQAKTRPGEVTTIQLLNKKNKPAGTIDCEFEIQSGTQNRFQITEAQSNLNDLIIKPKAGRFQRDADFFSKMDPLIKVTIGSETQKTETALNAGKFPTWKTPLNFKLSNQQVYYPDTVSITFEALDEDGTNKYEFLGAAVFKLSQAKLRPGETTTIQLLDKKNKNAGSIDVEFEIRQPMGTSQSSPLRQDKHAFKKPVIGTVVVKPTSAKFESGVNDNEEFYLVLTHGEISYQSMMSEGPGKKPTFKDIITFSLFENEDMHLRVFDNDINRNEQVAEGFIQISALARRGPLHNLLVPLSNVGRKIGEMTVEVEFIPDVFDNLVRVYPTLNVKRGESVTKKIQYTNPDRFKKTLTFKSTRRDLVIPMPETVHIQPNEFVEIKFKVSAPSTSEDRCRIDIIVEDTRQLEESLLFKVKSI